MSDPHDRPVRVVVVDDHPVFRLGMVSLLGSLAGIDVVGEAADHADAVRVVDRTTPDVVVMDLDLGGSSGNWSANSTRSAMVWSRPSFSKRSRSRSRRAGGVDVPWGPGFARSVMRGSGRRRPLTILPIGYTVI